MLPREEFIEQAYFYKTLLKRLDQNIPLQDLLEQTKHELLASTKLPLAIDFMLAELKHRGLMGTAMERLSHYFIPYQTFLVTEAELDRGKFDLRVALHILAAEADYRACEKFDPQGLFFFQFEAISRNRLSYDRGLLAMSKDPAYSEPWRQWLLMLRQQLGLVDLATMIYARSQYHQEKQVRFGTTRADKAPVLFGLSEGKIAYANRHKDPLFLFAAMQRHLGYPSVPRAEPPDPTPILVPQLMRRMERLEMRMRLIEEEQRGGIDITKFYASDQPPKSIDDVLGPGGGGKD